jgi:hypothetical protein
MQTQEKIVITDNDKEADQFSTKSNSTLAGDQLS